MSTQRDHDLSLLRSALGCAGLSRLERHRLEAHRAALEAEPGETLSRGVRGRLETRLAELLSVGAAPTAPPSECFPLREIPRRPAA